MPLPVIDGVCRVSCGGTIQGGGRWSNTWHARHSAGGTPDLAAITALELEFIAFYTAACFLSVPAGTTLEDVNVTPLDGSSGAFSFPVGLAGTGGTGSMPPEVAEVLTIRTALRGRRHRGRVFLPAFVKDDFDSAGHVSATAIARVQASAVALQAAAVISSWSLGVASYGISYKVDYHTSPPTRYPTTWTPEFVDVQSFSMDNQADVMRSRKT
jgi:hypothetical protein